MKTDSSGNSLWSKNYSGPEYESILCLIQTNDEGYALAGVKFVSEDEGYDCWLIKLGPDPAPLVTNTYSLNVDGYAFTVIAVTNSTMSNIDASDVSTTRNMSFSLEGDRGTSMCNITLPTVCLVAHMF